MRVRWYGGWWWFVLTCCPSCFSLSSLPPLFPPSSPLYPLLTLLTAHWWGVYPSFVVGCVLVVDERDSDALTCRIWRSFKLRLFSIVILIFIVAYVMAILKS